jgi:cell wall-associated NlpC family hydrolase
MSMREVMAWQREYVNNGSASSAAGRYQFLLGTLQSLVNTHNIPLNAQFDKDMQDRLAVHLLEKRNLNGYLRGNISAREFAHNLSMEWASLPRVIGSHPEASYYAGDGLNHSFVSVDKIMNIVKDLRRGATNNSPEHESHGLFNTVGELPQARQVVTRAKSFTRMSDSELTAMCDSNSGDACFQRCGRLAARAWGRESSGYTSAIVQWEAMKAKGKAHIGKRNIPVGALLYYDYDGSQYGHVAVYLGNNKVMSNDVKDDSRGEGGVYIVDTKDLEGGEWNLKYLGWSAPVYSSPHVSSWHKAPRSSKPRHHSQSSAPMTPPIGSSSGSDTTPVAPTVPARPTEISSADVPESDVDLGDVMSSLLS